MPKQLNQRLNFQIDISQARQQLKLLQAQMNALSDTSGFSRNFQNGLTNEIMSATKAATLLKTQLTQAINPLTGNLNLTKFNDQLMASQMNLRDYKNQLSTLGTVGNQAFNGLARSIASAETPLLRTSQAASAMWTALGNAARWTMTSTAIHGVMSTAASAMNYVQNLDKSLNNIRIVTGQTQEQMNTFATKANEAAKALNTSTNNYAKAALIYYQQGLSNKQVEERTETTIKLANVSGQSAKKVSDQLTAVWNNFYDGSKSLEYYADVMTALGASTASSSEEIAKGLSKFSSIAQTTGLSYEYATSALSTVVAATRQSADAVGTTFKTLFSRLQGLSLGDTLDDGVTLNKYSKALNTIGINVLNANGSLKDMDTILDELGNKWQNLNKSQQVALSQTIGGVRSYTGLMSLMDNWDQFQKNLITAQNAQGTLQKQADIYSESWEAASMHVRAASETIYKNLLNDDFFKGLTNGFGTVLDGIGALTNGLGGFKGTMAAIGNTAFQVFGNQIAGSFANIGLNLRSVVKGQQDIIDIKTQAREALREGIPFSNYDRVNQLSDFYNQQMDQRSLKYEQMQAQGKVPEYLKPVYQTMFANTNAMTDAALASAEQMYKNQGASNMYAQDQLRSMRNAVNQEQQKLNAAAAIGTLTAEQQAQRQAASSLLAQGAQGNTGYFTREGIAQLYKAQYQTTEAGILQSMLNPENPGTVNINQAKNLAGYIMKMDEGFKQMGTTMKDSMPSLTEYRNAIADLQKGLENKSLSIEDYNQKLTELFNNASFNGKNFNQVMEDIISAPGGANEIKNQMVNELSASLNISAQEAEKTLGKLFTDASMSAAEKADVYQKVGGASLVGTALGKTLNIQDAEKRTIAFSGALSNTLGLMTAGAQTFNALSQAAQVFSKEGATATEYMSSIAAVGMSMGMLIKPVQNFKEHFGDAMTMFGKDFTIGGKTVTQGGFGLTALLATAAITAGVALYKDQQKNSPEGIQKAYAAQTATATQLASESQQSYEQFEVNRETQSKLLDQLQSTTAGTTEFTQALINNNTVAQKMIEDYGLQYGKDYTFGKYGETIFNQERLDEAVERVSQEALERQVGQQQLTAASRLFDLAQQSESEQLLSAYTDTQFSKLLSGTPGDNFYTPETFMAAFLNSSLYGYSAQEWLEHNKDSFVLQEAIDAFGVQTEEELASKMDTIADIINNTQNNGEVNKAFSGGSSNLDMQNAITKGIVDYYAAMSLDKSYINNDLAAQIMSDVFSKDQMVQLTEFMGKASQKTFLEGLQGRKPEDWYQALYGTVPSSKLSPDEISTLVSEKILEMAVLDTQQLVDIATGLGFSADDLGLQGITGLNTIAEQIQQLNLPDLSAMTKEQTKAYFEDRLATNKLNQDLAKHYGASIDQLGKYVNEQKGLTKTQETYNKMFENLEKELTQSILVNYNDGLLDGTVTGLSEQVSLLTSDLTYGSMKELANGLSQASLLGHETVMALQEMSIQDRDLGNNQFASTFSNEFRNILKDFAFENSLNAVYSNTQLMRFAKNQETRDKYTSLLAAQIKDMGEEKGLFEKLYSASGFDKVMDKITQQFELTGTITAQMVDKLALKQEDLNQLIQIGNKGIEGANINSAGLASTFEEVAKGTISFDDVSSNLISALSTAGQTEAYNSAAFAVVDNLDLGRSGVEYLDYFRDMGKAFYAIDKADWGFNNDQLKSMVNLLGNQQIKDAFYEINRSGDTSDFSKLMSQMPSYFTDFLSTMAGPKGKGNGGGPEDVTSYMYNLLNGANLTEEDWNRLGFKMDAAGNFWLGEGMTSQELIDNLTNELIKNGMGAEEAANLAQVYHGQVATSAGTGAILEDSAATIAFENFINGRMLDKEAVEKARIAGEGHIEDLTNEDLYTQNTDLRLLTQEELNAFIEQNREFLTHNLESLTGQSLADLESYGVSLESYLGNYFTNQGGIIYDNKKNRFAEGMNLGNFLETFGKNTSDIAENTKNFQEIATAFGAYSAATGIYDYNKLVEMIEKVGGNEANLISLISQNPDLFNGKLYARGDNGAEISFDSSKGVSSFIGQVHSSQAARSIIDDAVSNLRSMYGDAATTAGMYWKNDEGDWELDIDGSKRAQRALDQELGDLYKQREELKKSSAYSDINRDPAYQNVQRKIAELERSGANSTKAYGYAGLEPPDTGTGAPPSPSSSGGSDTHGEIDASGVTDRGMAEDGHFFGFYQGQLVRMDNNGNWIYESDYKKQQEEAEKQAAKDFTNEMANTDQQEAEERAKAEAAQQALEEEAAQKAAEEKAKADANQADYETEYNADLARIAEQEKKAKQAEITANAQNNLLADLEESRIKAEEKAAAEAAAEAEKARQQEASDRQYAEAQNNIDLRQQILDTQSFSNEDIDNELAKGTTLQNILERAKAAEASRQREADKKAADEAKKAEEEKAAQQQEVDEYFAEHPEMKEAYYRQQGMQSQYDFVQEQKAKEAEQQAQQEAAAQAWLDEDETGQRTREWITNGKKGESLVDYVARKQAEEAAKAEEEARKAEEEARKAEEERIKAEEEAAAKQQEVDDYFAAHPEMKDVYDHQPGRQSEYDFVQQQKEKEAAEAAERQARLNEEAEQSLRGQYSEADLESFRQNYDIAEGDWAGLKDRLDFEDAKANWENNMSAEERTAAIDAARQQLAIGGENSLSSFQRSLLTALGEIGENVQTYTDLAEDAAEDEDNGTGKKRGTHVDEETGEIVDDETGEPVDLPYEQPTQTQTGSPGSSSSDTSPGGTPANNDNGSPGGTPKSSDVTSGFDKYIQSGQAQVGDRVTFTDPDTGVEVTREVTEEDLKGNESQSGSSDYSVEKSSSSSGGGCFAPGTQILMSNGKSKNIEDIKVGEIVIAYDENKKQFVSKLVTKSYVHHNTPTMVKLTFNTGKILELTPGHPLYSTNGWKSLDLENSLYEHGTIATLLNIGDIIIGINNNDIITNIEYLNIGLNYDSYNIEVEKCHTFLANGFVAHNMKMNYTGQNNSSILHYASGKEGHMAVTGELGPELTIRSNGSVDMLGQHGREYTWVNPDDIIYTAAQTASILGNNNIEWLKEYSKGFNNKIQGHFDTNKGAAADWNANAGTSGIGEAVRRGAYSGTYGGMMAAEEEEEKDPRYDINTLKERDILTRYFTILQQLDDINREIDRYAKTADRAWGEERITAIQQQTAAYKEQLKAYLEYQREVESYLQTDKDALSLMLEELAEALHTKTSTEFFGGEASKQNQMNRIAYSDGSYTGAKVLKSEAVYGGAHASGYNNRISGHAAGAVRETRNFVINGSSAAGGLTGEDGGGDPALRTPINWTGPIYDKNGVLTNYREVIQAMMEIYNENAELFAQDKEAQYKFQEMLKDIQFYTDTLNLYEQNQQTLIDLRRTILDNQIREIVYKISFEDELDTNRLREISYNFNKVRDSAYDAADRINSYAVSLDYLEKSMRRRANGVKDALATFSGNVRNGLEKAFNFKFYQKSPMQGYIGTDSEENPLRDALGNFLDIDIGGGVAYKSKEILNGSSSAVLVSGSSGIAGLTEAESKKLAIDYIDDETGFIYLNDGSWIDPKKKKRYRKKSVTGTGLEAISGGAYFSDTGGAVVKSVTGTASSIGSFTSSQLNDENSYTDEYGFKHKKTKGSESGTSSTNINEIGRLLYGANGVSGNLYSEDEFLKSASGGLAGSAYNKKLANLPEGDGLGLVTVFENGHITTKQVDSAALKNAMGSALNVPDGAKVLTKTSNSIGYLSDGSTGKVPDVLRLSSGEYAAIGPNGPEVIDEATAQKYIAAHNTEHASGAYQPGADKNATYRTLWGDEVHSYYTGEEDYLSRLGLGGEGEDVEEIPYFPTEYEINEYMKNFKKVQIGEETYYMPISDDVEVRDDITPAVKLDQIILNNKGELTKDMKEIVTKQVQGWYDELVKLHPQLAVDIIPEYDKDGFMTNYREVMEQINKANAQMSDEAYQLLLRDPHAFFELFSEITDANINFEDVTADLASFFESEMQGFYDDVDAATAKAESAVNELNTFVKQGYKDLQEQIAEYDFFGDIVSNYKDIINLTNRALTDIDRGLIETLDQSAFNNAINKINGTKAAYETEKKEYDRIQKMYDEKKGEMDAVLEDLKAQGLDMDKIKLNYTYSSLHDTVLGLESDLKNANSKVEDAEKEFLQSWEDALDKAVSKYNTAMDEAARAFDESFDPIISSISAFVALVERERASEDLYLDDYERIHDLSALNRAIEQAALDTDNLKSKARLRDLQKEINDLQDKGIKLSSYDLEILNKKYQIELARQALEDAKDAKSIVRLTRDNNGNWSYAYTSNDIEVEEAKQDYEDAIRDMEKLSQDYVKNIQTQIYQIGSQAQEELAAITPDSYNGDVETQERMRQSILKSAFESMDFIKEQMGNAFGNNGWLAPFIEDIYGENNHNLYDEFIDTAIGKVSGFNSLDDLIQNSKDLLDTYNTNTADYAKELYNDQKAAYDMAGVNMETAGEYFTAQLAAIDEASDDNINKINEVIEEIDYEFDRLMDSLESFFTQYFDPARIAQITEWELLYHNLTEFLEDSGYYEPEERLDFASAVDTYEELEAIKQGLAKYGKLLVTDYDEEGEQHFYHLAEGAASTAEQLTKWYDAAAKGDTIDVGKDLDEREEYDKINKYLEEHGQVYIEIDGEIKKISKNNVDDMAWMQEKLKAIEEAEKEANEIIGGIGNYLESSGSGKNYDEPYYHSNGDGTSTVYPYYGAENPVGTWNSNNGTYTPLDTGGYTGRWQGMVYADTGLYTGEWDGGSVRRNGRLAWLHQKELVLNAHDTENFLDAMNIVRQLDNLTSWMANGLGDLFTPQVASENDVLEQNVHIDASFPNVTDHNEIEEAFGNLVNLASQYANRKSFT